MSNPLLAPIEQYVIDVVRNKRIENGWSQKELAIRMGLSTGFIGDIESTKEDAKYNLKHINELAKVFDCSPKEFIPKEPL